MSYQYNTALIGSSNTIITESDVYGSLQGSKFHTIQCSGDACLVEMQVGNNTNYVVVDTIVDGIENMNAYGVTAIRLTITTGSCEIAICGTVE